MATGETRQRRDLATEAQHLLQFERNHEVAERLSNSGDFDWAVVALFYAALHLVQAHLVKMGAPARSHSERNRQILVSDELLPTYDPYMTLRAYSEEARYECRRFSESEYEAIRGGVFATVVAHMQSLKDDS